MIAALLLVACGGSTAHKYDTSLMDLAVAFSAKEVCSCVFVAGQTQEACAEWSRVSPDIANFEVHPDEGTVTSRALGFWSVTATYAGPEEGCKLDPPKR